MSVARTKLATMQANPTWANLGIICFDKDFGYSIETISVDANSCTLSGAWDFETLDDPDIPNILSSRLIVTSGLQDRDMVASRFACTRVDIKTFISDASDMAIDGVERFNKYVEENVRQYSEYMSIPPAERKLIPKVIKKKLEPIYAHSWNLSFDELRPELTLRQLGKRDSISGTPTNMKRLIATSWLTKHLVDRWRQDEVERTSRSYLYPEGRNFQVLPSSWMKSLIDFQETIQR